MSTSVSRFAVRYTAAPGPADAPLALLDMLCEPELPSAGPHRLLVPAGWRAMEELPRADAPGALQPHSLFVEPDVPGPDAASIVVGEPPAVEKRPEDMIRSFAHFEGLETHDLVAENPGDVRAICSSDERFAFVRALASTDGKRLMLIATGPVARFDELQPAFHWALISIEPLVRRSGG